MKNLIIAVCFMALLIIPCSIFLSYSKNTVDICGEAIDTCVTSLKAGNWERADGAMTELEDRWTDYKKISTYFLNNRDMEETEALIHKAHEYVSIKDVSNACGELMYLKKTLQTLHNSQCLSMGNLF